MSSPNIWFMILSWIIGAYLLYESMDFVWSRCCYKPPSAAMGSQHRLSMWGDDLSAIANNPKTLGRAALVKLAKVIQEVTGSDLITRGELVKSLSSTEKFTLLLRLMRKCGVMRGFKAYATLMDGLSHYPDTIDKAIYFCDRMLREAEVLASACR